MRAAAGGCSKARCARAPRRLPRPLAPLRHPAARTPRDPARYWSGLWYARRLARPHQARAPPPASTTARPAAIQTAAIGSAPPLDRDASAAAEALLGDPVATGSGDALGLGRGLGRAERAPAVCAGGAALTTGSAACGA